MDTLLAGQNEDGGFGLTADYASDTLDTLLALEACHTAGKREQAEAAAEYLLSVQKEDGSWSYAEGGAADTVLTARAGSAILHQQNNGDGYLDEEKLRLTESCLSSANRYALTQEKLAETLYLSLYDSEWGMSIPEAKARAEALAEIQETDGSFYGDISLTALAVRVLVRLDGLAPAVKIEDFALALSPQGIYAGAPVQLSASYTMEYYANYNTAYTVKIAVIKENGTVLAEKEQEIPLTAGRESRTGKLLELEINEPETGVLTVKAEIRDEAQKLVGEYSREFNVKEQLKVSERFQLDAEVTEGKDYGLRLSWNELSDEETDYTYRIWQKKEDAGWTTRSVWNEESRVKVLNVYPTTDTRNCTKNWMETTVDSGAEPAGKGLFDITPVYLDEYNRNAEACLLDAEGNYQYDVLFFGAADCNGKKDLTEGSYQATRKFIDSGRGVLFGHDTVCLVVDRINQMEHNFAKFSEQLGILVKDKFYQSNTNKAEICNTGFLTSYPWKISGTLNIPATHSVGQFCGGTLEGTVWVKLLNSYVQTDGATGARTDAYLVTNNQLGLIMTGHSTNQATDDERKILANTLFYLKQVSSETELCDCSFIDEAAPEKVRAASAVSACEADKFRLSTTLEAADRGTNYQYYAEAQPERSSGRENEASNHISAEALSGIRGYVYEINTNPEAMPELITYEADGRTVYGVTEAAEDGRLVFETPELSCEETYYLHAYAVDWANCVSEELVEKLSWQEADCPYNGIITELSMNKEVSAG